MEQGERTEAKRIIDHARQLSGLSKKALAQKAGVSAETLSRIGTRGTADFLTVLKVVRAAGVDLATAAASGGSSGQGSVVARGGHARMDDRSLVLHALIAGKLLANPALIEKRVLPNVRRFKSIHAGSGTVRLLDEWERAARAGVHALLRICTDPSEHGKQLRQTSPLTGLLLASERRSVYESFSA